MNGGIGPIAVGGVGGSGTRVVARVLRELGFYLGGSLNEALDNLWFTLLFKRPGWFTRFPSEEDVSRALNLFRRAMTEGLATRISRDERAYIRDILADAEHSPAPLGVTIQHAQQLIESVGPNPENYIGWAWKEPNTHVFLAQLCREMDGLRYIHVIRHGLDMAFSANQQQALNWGPHFGIEPERLAALSPSTMLDYWAVANESVMRIGPALLKDRFLLLDFDLLCAEPVETLRRLCDLVSLEASEEDVARLALLPRTPQSTGRFREWGTAQFSEEQLGAVRRLGFSTP